MTALAASSPPALHRLSSPWGGREVLVGEADALWAELEPAVRAMKLLVARMDRDAIRTGGFAPGACAQLELAFAQLEQLLQIHVGDASAWSAAARESVGARAQAEVLPFMLLGENAERWYSKPRGYAGDYLSIAQMYDDVPRGHGRLGAAIDRCFLNLAAVRAVQNRRALMVDEIRSTVAQSADRPARVTSLACGPARELFDVYATLPDPTVLSSTLVDLDLHALAHVADHRDRAGLKRQMTLANDNLIYLATGRTTATFGEQDLVYSIGLVDYFDDPLVVKLLDFIHGVLVPGGRVVVGNFHPRNGTRAVMDYVLDWKLVHRTEDDMHRLFRASAFARPCTRIAYERERINLFAECVKE